MDSKIPKIVFVSESIRRDSNTPLKYFKDFEVVHLYLNSPYKDMDKDDYKLSRQVTIESLRQEIIKEAPDFLQGTEPFGSRLSLKLSYIILKAQRATGAKLIVSILENRPIEKRFSKVQRAVLKVFCPRYFKAASILIALNKGATVNIKRYFRQAKVKTGMLWGIWGVDTKVFYPSRPKEKNTVLYVGRWVEEKGVMFLLEGFLKASKKISNLRLNLVGQGPLEAEMRKFVQENGLDSSVSFVGQVKSTKLVDLFSSAEICIYPSVTTDRWEEQIGTVNFQSMSCGTPVISTLSGAIPEYIKDGEGAMLVEEKSSDAIAEALVKFFADAKHKTRLTNSARQEVMKYDVKVEVAKAEKMLKENL